MQLFLIRHAQAGDRSHGVHDLHRPLTDEGHRRARQLAALLEGTPIEKVMSSPATRCVQTVEPLAAAAGLPVEEEPELWEGSSIERVLGLLETQPVETLVACSHGDVIPEVIEAVSRDGATVSGRGCRQGSVWVLGHDGQAWRTARYLDRSHGSFPAHFF